MRHPLARALAGAGLDAADVAARLDVDPKTVGRWLAGRLPYPRHRTALQRLTGWSTHELWPQCTDGHATAPAAPEIRVAYPHRAAVAPHIWRRHFAAATQEIGILAYSALFLAEDNTAQQLLRDQARAGVRVRIVLGDPDGDRVARRGAEEGIGELMTGRVRNSLILFRALADTPGAELRLHDTVLQNSIYRADGELLVNSHIYGAPASHAPVLHLHHAGPHGVAAHYLDSFNQVWATARRP